MGTVPAHGCAVRQPPSRQIIILDGPAQVNQRSLGSGAGVSLIHRLRHQDTVVSTFMPWAL